MSDFSASIGKTAIALPGPARSPGALSRLRQHAALYILFFPPLAYYVVFRYIPMVGSVYLSFTDYDVFKGMFESRWVGFANFLDFFRSVYFERVLWNTLVLNVLNLLFVFTAPIVFAILLNELPSARFRKAVQTVSYLPNFISVVIIASLTTTFLSPTYGFVNNLIAFFGGKRVNFLQEAGYFRGIYTLVDLWKSMGWNAIIYMAALTGIHPELYEAAMIDGAGRLRRILHVTLPGILPVIVIMLLLKIGHFLEVGFEMILLLYNTSTYQTADVINTYVYRRGVLDASYSFSSAVGLFQSAFGLVLLLAANRAARKLFDTGLF